MPLCTYEDVDTTLWDHLRRVEYVAGFGDSWDRAMENFRNGVIRYWEVPVKFSWSVGMGRETAEVWVGRNCPAKTRELIAACLTGVQLTLNLR